jgi:ATP-dependent DNA ligase
MGSGRSLPVRCVLGGEIVLVRSDRQGLDFWALQQRLHPAASRAKQLTAMSTSSFIAFDLLAMDDYDHRPHPFRERRAALERVLTDAAPPIHLTPTTSAATGWRVGASAIHRNGPLAA